MRVTEIRCAVLLAANLLLVSLVTANGADAMIWPLYRGNAQRTGVSPFKGPVKMQVRWERPMTHEIASAPVINAIGNLYLAVGTGMWCFDNQGKERWQHDFAKSRHAKKFGGGHGAFISASPGLGADGWLVQPMGSLFSVAHVLGFRTDAPDDKHLAWAAKIGGVSRSAPLIVDGASYVVIEGLMIGYQSDGKAAWQTRGPFFVNCAPALIHDGATIYVGGSDGNVHALDRVSGRLKWKAGARSDATVPDPMGSIPQLIAKDPNIRDTAFRLRWKALGVDAGLAGGAIALTDLAITMASKNDAPAIDGMLLNATAAIVWADSEDFKLSQAQLSDSLQLSGSAASV